MNAEAEQVARRPGRPKREEVTETSRRRRKGGKGHKLAIPEEVKEKHPNMEFRWARDDGSRMDQLTKSDDWDKVPGVKPIYGGAKANGAAMELHLLMKPTAFMEQDRAEKEEAMKRSEQARLAHPDAKTATESGADVYSVPGNKI
jgi:hypothetical protein